MSRTSLSWLLYSESICLNENDRQMQQCRRLPLKAQFLHRIDLELKLLIMSIADQKVSRCSPAVQVVTTRIRVVYIPIYLQVIETVFVCFLSLLHLLRQRMVTLLIDKPVTHRLNCSQSVINHLPARKRKAM
jgi:hypothetical protein